MHVPRTREQEEQHAKVTAKLEEKNSERGIFADLALHFVNGIAYCSEGSRPDTNHAINQLQKKSANWDREADRLLDWFFGC